MEINELLDRLTDLKGADVRPPETEGWQLTVIKISGRTCAVPQAVADELVGLREDADRLRAASNAAGELLPELSEAAKKYNERLEAVLRDFAD